MTMVPPTPTPTPAAAGNWLRDNWDKVLTVFVSMVLAGVVGFFTAVIAIEKELADLGERVARVESQIKTSLAPKAAMVEQQGKDITTIQTNMNSIREQANLSAQMNNLLTVRIEEVSERVMKELKAFYDDFTTKTEESRSRRR